MADVLYVVLTVATFAVLALIVKGSSVLSADNIIGLIAAVALSVYLILALVKPERF